jgi:hypothetical protein
MTLLSIFHTGGLTLALTVIFALAEVFFLSRAIKAHNSGWDQQVTGGIIGGPEKIPFHKIHYFWFAVGIFAAYVFALIQIASDYKGV